MTTLAAALAIVRDLLLIIVLAAIIALGIRFVAALEDVRDRTTGAAVVTDPDPAARPTCDPNDLGVLGC